MNIVRIIIVMQLLWSASLVGILRAHGHYSDEHIILRDVVYRLGQDLQLNCTPNGDGDYTGYGYTWLKNDSALERRFELRASDAVLYVTNATEDDFGAYECNITASSDNVVGTITWHVAVQPEVSLPPHVNFTEGSTLVLHCAVRGKPYYPVSWMHERDAVQAVSGRAELCASSAGVPSGLLKLANVSRSDAGLYSCRMRNVTATTTVNVIDQEIDRHTSEQGLSPASPRREQAAPPRAGGGAQPTRGGVLAVAGTLFLASCFALYLYCRHKIPHCSCSYSLRSSA